MKKLLLALMLVLTACTKSTDTGLVTSVQIPPLPENLAQKVGPLPPSNDLTMGGQVLDNTHNIRSYNSAATKTNKLIDLYNCVKDAVNNKKEFKCQ